LDSGSSSSSVSGSTNQGPRQRHALLLSARQFTGISLRENLEFCRCKDRSEFLGDGVAIEFA